MTDLANSTWGAYTDLWNLLRSAINANARDASGVAKDQVGHFMGTIPRRFQSARSRWGAEVGTAMTLPRKFRDSQSSSSQGRSDPIPAHPRTGAVGTQHDLVVGLLCHRGLSWAELGYQNPRSNSTALAEPGTKSMSVSQPSGHKIGKQATIPTLPHCRGNERRILRSTVGMSG